jgi:hypothetical protein
MDHVPLSHYTNKLKDKKSNLIFFDAICMLAFADTQEHVAIGEFIRTIIKEILLEAAQVNLVIHLKVVTILYLNSYQII